MGQQSKGESATNPPSELTRELAGVLTYHCDTDENRTLQSVRGQFQELTGYDSTQFVDGDEGFLSLVHPEDRESVRARIDEAVREDESYNLEYRLVTADNGIRHVVDKGHSVSVQNETNSTEGIILDRTPTDDRAIYVQPQSQFQPLLENMDAVTWIMSPEHDRVEYVSSTYETIWGRPTDEIYKDPRSFLDLVHPEDEAAVRRTLFNRTSPRTGSILRTGFSVTTEKSAGYMIRCIRSIPRRTTVTGS